MTIVQTIIKHIRETSIFVLAVSLAAVAHSSWTFATVLSGDEPADLLARIPWIGIGLFLAFSLDIGLLALSGEIRAGKRSIGRFIAFIVLALAMAYLQTVYCLVHAPVLTLSKAVRAEWIGAAQMVLDLAVFVTPALLPVGIILHTFSGENSPRGETASQSHALALVPSGDVEQVTIEKAIEIECPDCEWAGVYDTQTGARNALTAHRSKKHAAAAVSSNGRGE